MRRDSLISPAITALAVAWGVIFAVVTVMMCMTEIRFQHFSLQAESFLQGKLELAGRSQDWWYDTVEWEGKNYWPLGPVPALLLVPAVAAWTAGGGWFYQGYMQWILVGAVLGLVYILGRKTGYGRRDALFWAFGAVWGSVFMGLAMVPTSWMFGQIVATLLIFAVFGEHVGRRRYWVIGTLMGLVAATRLTMGLGIGLWVGEIVTQNEASWREKMGKLIRLVVPFGLVVLMLGWYNWARFGSVWEQGYSRQRLEVPALAKAREYGLFAWVHVPTNIYYSWLAVPQPVLKDGVSKVLQWPFIRDAGWGLAWWVTSPYLLRLFWGRGWDRFGKMLILTSSFIMVPILFYYGVGYIQFGYRYAMDFLPFWIWAAMRKVKTEEGGLSLGMRLTILLSGLFNFYILAT